MSIFIFELTFISFLIHHYQIKSGNHHSAIKMDFKHVHVFSNCLRYLIHTNLSSHKMHQDKFFDICNMIHLEETFPDMFAQNEKVKFYLRLIEGCCSYVNEIETFLENMGAF